MPERILYEAVGKFSVQFELMCQEMEECIEAILNGAGLNNTTLINIIVADKTADPLQKLLFSLLAEALPATEAGRNILSKCNTQIQKLVSERNKLIHTKWLVTVQGKGLRAVPLALGKKIKAGNKGDVTEYEDADLQRFTSAIDQCYDALEWLVLIRKCVKESLALESVFRIEGERLLIDRDALHRNIKS